MNAVEEWAAALAAVRAELAGTETAERIVKLPAWAQTYMSKLEGHIVSLRRALADGPADTDTWVDGTMTVPDRPLHPGTQITFAAPDVDPKRVRQYMNVKVEDGDPRVIVVRSSSGLAVEPVASNVVRIRRVDR